MNLGFQDLDFGSEFLNGPSIEGKFCKIAKFFKKVFSLQGTLVAYDQVEIQSSKHPSQNQQEPELDNQIFPGDENLGIHKLIDLKMIV